MIPFHRLLALATLASMVCLAALVLVCARTSSPLPMALRGPGDVRSSLGSVVHLAYAAPAAQASPDQIYLPVLSKGHPLAVCRGGMGEAAAVEYARVEVWMLGLWSPDGSDGNADILSAARMTAAEHDARYPQDDPLLEDVSPIPPEWTCYWRVEVIGHGWLRAGPPGAQQIEINRGLVVFPTEGNEDYHLPSMLSVWWEDEGTPGVEATSTATPGAPTATARGPRPSVTASATARAWASPTPWAR